MESPTKIYHRKDLPIADYLMTFQNDLRQDFLKGFDTLEDACKGEWVLPSLDYSRGDISKELGEYMVHKDNEPDLQAWRASNFKYTNPDRNFEYVNSNEEQIKRFPTAYSLLKEYDNDCPIMNYSILAPNTKINRHDGIENRSGEFIRIHIPLVIPEGDIFLEVGGEIVTWKDIFAFNNQWKHSAHNRSNEWRLIFLIDIRRERAGVEPGVPYDEEVYKVYDNFEELDPKYKTWDQFKQQYS